MQDIKFGVVGYIPPARFGNTPLWRQNLSDCPPKHPLHLYSWEFRDQPGVIPLKGNPDKAWTGKNHMAVNNAVFYTGVIIAWKHGLTHMLYIEEDCRFGQAGWDDIMLAELLEKDPEAYMAGCPVVFNPSSWDGSSAVAFERFIERTKPRPYPIPVAGNSRLAEKQQACVFVNGALAIYSVDWLLQIFPELKTGNISNLVQNAQTWDYEIGLRLWKQCGEKSYDKIVALTSCYSGYGNLITSEQQRKDWLQSGKIVAVHQIKSGWTPEKIENGGVLPHPEREKMSISETSDEEPKTDIEPVFDPRTDMPPPFTKTPEVRMLIVTFARDLQFTRFNLASIRKFARGFAGVTLVVPDRDEAAFKPLAEEFQCDLKGITERPGKGFLAHMIAVCSADLFTDAEYILHTDADCMFKEAVEPEDYFKDGKPVLLTRPYGVVRDKLHAQWRTRAEHALGFPVTHDFMVRHPAVHHRSLYPAVRKHMEHLHQTKFDDWVYGQQNEFPQGFAEFPTLGAFASKEMADKYSIIDIGGGPLPANKLVQGWSRGGVDTPIGYADGFKGSARQLVTKVIGAGAAL